MHTNSRARAPNPEDPFEEVLQLLQNLSMSHLCHKVETAEKNVSFALTD